ncbi:MAG: hypothetical protein WBP93_11180 [Pyrinomonadaceae bacterium]
MGRPKLTVRPTVDELKRLHELAGQAGYDSLSAYLVDCGLSNGGVLPREYQTLESLKFHIRLLTSFLEEEDKRKRKKILEQIPSALLVDIAQRAWEAIQLLNKILSRASIDQGSVG